VCTYTADTTLQLTRCFWLLSHKYFYAELNNSWQNVIFCQL